MRDFYLFSAVSEFSLSTELRWKFNVKGNPSKKTLVRFILQDFKEDVQIGSYIPLWAANACVYYIRAKLCVKGYKKIDIDFLIH